MSLPNKPAGTTDSAVALVDNLVDNIMNFIESLFRSNVYSLDDFARKSSDEIDRIILNKLKDGNEFGAGLFKLVYINESSFRFSFEVYLKTPNKKEYVCLSSESKPISMTKLDGAAREELRQRKEVAYEIEDPRLGKGIKSAENPDTPDNVSLSQRMSAYYNMRKSG